LKKLTSALLLACIALSSTMTVHAQGYPNRPVKIVVPTTAGDGSDVLARTLAKSLTDAMKQTFYVENKPGAGGSIAADYVAKSPADGYTMFLGNGSTQAVTPALYPNLPYDSVADFSPVVMISTAPNVLVVNSDLGVNTVAEFIALAKKQPGKLTLASGGNGSISHLSVELLKSMAGIDVLHVPYKGAAPALMDISSGQVSGMIINIPSVLPLLSGGKLKALGVTSLTPAETLPNVPTLDKTGVPGYQTMAWFGFMMPAKTPPEVVQAVYMQTVKALAQPDVKAELLKLGAEPAGANPHDFAAFIKVESAKYAKIIKDANIKLQ